MAQAEEWQRLLTSGQVRNRAALAQRFGVSGMRVTQVLALLKLTAPIREAIKRLPPGTPARLVTERRLRTLTGLSEKEQVAALADLLDAMGAEEVA